MSNQTRQLQNYSLNQPINFQNPNPIIANRAPTTADKAPIGQLWIFVSANSVYVLTSVVNNLANWQLLEVGGGGGVLTSLTVNPGPTNLSTVGNGAVNIGNATNTGAITITAGTGNIALVGAGHTIGIGNDAAANTVIVGSTTGAAVTTIQGGTAGVAVNTSATGTITIGLPTMTGTITLGQSTAVAGQVINIGNSAAPNAVNIGTLNGAAETTISAGTGGIVMLAGGNISMGPATPTPVASPTATVVSNTRVGYAVFTGFSTAPAADQIFTITNSVVTANSAIFVTVGNQGTNDAEMTMTRVNAGAGTFNVDTINNGAAALNGNVTITWWVIN
jgi:hypothetical protein